jgi:N-acetylglucosamine kinase-like BadF-type ATPase
MLIIGVDAGGTKTEAVLLGDGGVVSFAYAGPSNPASVGLEAACNNIREAVEGLGAGRPDAVGLGVAGLVDERLADSLGRCLGLGDAVFVEDVEAAHVSAFLFGDGVVGVLGTGSSFLGVKGSAKVRVGGWGHLLGDEGGAYYLGREALRRALREAEGLDGPGCLAEDVFKYYGARGTKELLYAIYSSENPRGRIAEYAPRVFALAGRCEEARELLRRAAAHVAEYIAAVLRALGPLPVALTGSVYLNNEGTLKPLVEAALGSLGYRVDVGGPAIRQSCAAALIAARSRGASDRRLVEAAVATCRL